MSTTALQVMDHENPGALMRQATDVAGVCREIVMKTACNIQGRKYVKAEGWMAIATAHGCIASSRDVQRVEGGWVAIGEIRRISDGVLLSQAEGYVGKDEKRWGSADEYACRAMAQTRAISRACRAAFAHVVVLIDGGLSTTPAEEVPDGGFENAKPVQPAKPVQREFPRPQPTTTTLAPAPTPAVSFKNATERTARLNAFLLKCKLKLVSDLERGDPQQAVEFMQKAGHLMPNETALSEANELTMFPSVRHEPASGELDGEWWAMVGEDVAKDAAAIKRAFNAFAQGDQLDGGEIGHQAEFVVEPDEEKPVIPANAKELAGFIKLVNKKPTSRGGTKYGILIVQDLQDREGGEWLNTFDDKDGELAESFKGQAVTVAYTDGQYGKDLCKHAILSNVPAKCVQQEEA